MRPLNIMLIEPGVNFSVMDVHNGWVDALTDLGHNVKSVNFADRLGFFSEVHLRKGKRYKKAVSDRAAVMQANSTVRADAYAFLPDVIIVTAAFFVTDETLDLFMVRGHKVVLVHTESPYEDDRQIARARHAHINIVNDPTNLHLFPTNTYYQPHCYNPKLHRPHQVDAECASEFCFVGTGFPSRIAFFEQVDWSGIDAAFAGNWKATEPDSPLRKFMAHDIEQCLDNRDTADLYCGTEISANLYRKEAERDELSHGWAVGPREIELAACGTFFLREPRAEGDLLFPMLPTFDSPKDFEDKLRYYLNHPQERIEAAQAARAAIVDRTFLEAAGHLLVDQLGYPQAAAST